MISTSDDALRHSMAAAADTVLHPRHSELRAGQPEENEVEGPTLVDQTVNPRCEGAAGQGSFRGEGSAKAGSPISIK